MEYKKEKTKIPLDQLSSTEELVYRAIAKGNYDKVEIAKECRLSDLELKVALQLLVHKEMLPDAEPLT
jgi:hypothetical protein